MSDAQKVNWIALVGAPNVGKSTLLNALIGQKISIVTPKPQTTRNLIKGIKIIDDTQLIFTDSPGIFQSKNRAGQIMVKAAWQCIESADQVCLIVDATKHSNSDNVFVMRELKRRNCKYSLVINKIDLLPKPELLGLITFFQTQDEFKNIFLISALKQDGLNGLLKFFLKTARAEHWPFDQEQVTDAPLEFMIAEIIREKIFMHTHEEVPYNLSVEDSSLKEERGITFIHADILVRDQSHKKILIGSKGSMLKKIGMTARCALESTFHKKFCLYTNVKVGFAKNETSGDRYGT